MLVLVRGLLTPPQYKNFYSQPAASSFKIFGDLNDHQIPSFYFIIIQKERPARPQQNSNTLDFQAKKSGVVSVERMKVDIEILFFRNVQELTFGKHRIFEQNTVQSLERSTEKNI